MPAHEVLASIFDNLAPIRKWQRRFLTILFSTIFALRGRLNFTNMARYSPLHEHTFRRQFEKDFDWPAFNLALIEHASKPEQRPGHERIGVFDCSFIRKSGTKTYGLDRFWSGCESRVKRGLEISLLGCISVATGQAFALDVVQTPPALSNESEASYSRIDVYMEQFLDCLDQLQAVRYMVADGEYARKKPFETVTEQGKHLITKLRSDANLRFFSDGKRAPGQKGRTPRYAGKVHWQALAETLWRFDDVGTLEDHGHVRLYTQVLNSPYFKRDLRVVVLINTKTQQYVILASTDLEQPARQVVAYYRLRFQVEFLFRDAKQFTGLEHCQARDQAKLDFHFNMSLSAVNLARVEMSRQGISFNSYVRLAYNRFLVTCVLEQLGLEAEYDLNHPGIQQVIHLGRMAA